MRELNNHEMRAISSYFDFWIKQFSGSSKMIIQIQYSSGKQKYGEKFQPISEESNIFAYIKPHRSDGVLYIYIFRMSAM